MWEIKKADFQRFVSRFDQATIETAFHDLVASCDSDPFVANGYEKALTRTLCDRISRRQPTSCIRLGDGEGDLLGVDDPKFGDLTMAAAQRTVLRQFGMQLSMQELVELRQRIGSAIAGADILGIPTLGRIRVVFRRIHDSDVDMRGSCGVINAVRCTLPIVHGLGTKPIITDCFFHRQLLPHFAEILGRVESLGLISCLTELPAKISKHFSVENVDFYEIPDEFMNVQQAPEKPHYPERFNEIIRSLTLREPGQVFLVAAGVLGKIYCHHIKKLGGVAIDIGSMADVWAGKQTLRPYQTAEFVQRWKLQ